MTRHLPRQDVGISKLELYRQPYVCAARRSPMHSKCHRRATEESGGMDSKAVPGFKMGDMFSSGRDSFLVR